MNKSRAAVSPVALLSVLALPSAATTQCPVGIDLNPGTGFSRPAFYEPAFGQELYFALSEPTFGLELWKWSPATGVVLVADVKAGSGFSRPESMTACCTAMGPRVFFNASDTGINSELWMTDGTPGNFAKVAEIRPGSSGSVIGNMVAVGPRVFFTAQDGTTGNELWVSDGTGPGTHLVKDIRAGTNSNPQSLTALGDLVLFIADDGSGKDLWVSDGTDPGTINLGDLVAGIGTSPYELTPCGDVVYFTTGDELWKTDGTAVGTTIVQNVKSTWNGSSLNRFTCCGDRLFFTASVSGQGSLLFASDGTDAGTYRVEDDPVLAVKSPRLLTPSNGRVFFTGSRFDLGTELWVSDGTDAGTMLAADIQAGPLSSSPLNLTAIGNGVCFGADDGSGTGTEPWFSDGTTTFMLCDIDPSGSSRPSDFHIVSGQLWMMATAPSIGTEPHVLTTPGAHIQRLGVGGAPDYTVLKTRDDAAPILGNTIDIVADDGPAGHAGLLLVGPAGVAGPPLPPLMQGGCDWVGLLSGAGFAVAAATGSNLSVSLPIPLDPTLEGATLVLQMMWIDAGSTPPIQLSSGLLLVFGESVPH